MRTSHFLITRQLIKLMNQTSSCHSRGLSFATTAGNLFYYFSKKIMAHKLFTVYFSKLGGFKKLDLQEQERALKTFSYLLVYFYFGRARLMLMMIMIGYKWILTKFKTWLSCQVKPAFQYQQQTGKGRCRRSASGRFLINNETHRKSESVQGSLGLLSTWDESKNWVHVASLIAMKGAK